MKRKVAGAAVGILSAVAVGVAAPALLRGEPEGFLGASAPDTIAILPPAPKAGSERDQIDRAIFRETRGLKGSPRWNLATRDAEKDQLLDELGCVLGFPFTEARAPHTVALIERIRRTDIKRAVDRPKDFYARKRPYLVDAGPTCVAQTPSLLASPDYPSGHATYGWAVGLILAELVPDRATAILTRARAYGDSRLVCGVHSLSAVDAGRTNASVVVAALHGSEAFRQEMEVARRELAADRKVADAGHDAAFKLDSAACATDPKLMATPY